MAESYLMILKDLIKGELVAAIQYKIAADSCIGPNQSYLVKHFNEHYEDEMSHYTLLMTALMSRNEKPDINLDDIKDRAIPSTVEMTSNISSYLRKFFEDRESEAIDAYREFHEIIKNIDADLDDIVMGIMSDERDHRLDMTRIMTDSDSAIKPVEPVSLEDVFLEGLKKLSNKIRLSKLKGYSVNEINEFNKFVKLLPSDLRDDNNYLLKCREVFQNIISDNSLGR